MSTRSDYSWFGPARLLARTTMIGNAIVFLGCGFALLTDPLHVPLTVVLWLAGAVIAALAILTPLPE